MHFSAWLNVTYYIYVTINPCIEALPVAVVVPVGVIIGGVAIIAIVVIVVVIVAVHFGYGYVCEREGVCLFVYV